MMSQATFSSPSTPVLGRSQTILRKSAVTTGRAKGKANGNIMTFFKKAEPQDISGTAKGAEDNDLFLTAAFEADNHVFKQTPTLPNHTPQKESVFGEESAYTLVSPPSRYNEEPGPSKRKKVEDESAPISSVETSTQTPSARGPFLDDSEDEEEPRKSLLVTSDKISASYDRWSPVPASKSTTANSPPNSPRPPPLKHETTSLGAEDEFENMEDFIDDEFPEEGEEYMERRWMEEQAQMEAEIEKEIEGGFEREDGSLPACRLPETESLQPKPPDNAAPSRCPICGGDTTGMTEQQVSVHVNDCLDGKAAPLQSLATVSEIENNAKAFEPVTSMPGHKRFQRAAIARPGQENPFSLKATSSKSSSAFSKLMSGHAEDTAWAAAAASEVASRGKPAYQRTCPFYKIMPGLSICVDAFRYGAVQGCNAYFLSHFHSDHYIGLTSSWRHGPIYCSHVTANLVRQQLRVDPKWVVDLEFENKIEVPNTPGVEVTMIPANHCPGSSLFLFEKVLAKGRTPKVQRILHCGDFRACPAHVQHPKLRPEIVDHVSGKLAQQKLDVCYLDTTYLTPKYAFPRQEDVIKACGDMCISLSKDFVDDSDDWEKVKKERAGAGMVKFVRQASTKEENQDHAEIKIEDEQLAGDLIEPRNDTKIKVEDEQPMNKLPTATNKARGRLLVIVGTYSIGKERICLGIAKALDSKIYAPAQKQRVVAALEDPELSSRMTSDPLEAQVHMQMLMEIRAETLADYLTGYKPHFSRIVGFRPSGWNYRPPNSRFTESPSVQTVLHSDNWKSRFTMAELVPQRGSTREANCFGVPYSEHSSFRELTMFCCALRIDKIIPTVNVGSAKSRERMKAWCEKWAMEKKKSGLYRVEDGQVGW